MSQVLEKYHLFILSVGYLPFSYRAKAISSIRICNKFQKHAHMFLEKSDIYRLQQASGEQGQLHVVHQ